MADVRLDFYDLDDDVLPDVCMKCGAPAAARPMKTFSWVPYWARMIPFGIAFMKRRRVPIPLCERHKNHWMIRYLIGFGGLALFLLLLGAAIALLISSDDRTNPARDTLMALGFIVLTGAGIAFLTWLITLIVLLVTQINVFEITDDSIVLTNVSPDFTGLPGADAATPTGTIWQGGNGCGRRPAGDLTCPRTTSTAAADIGAATVTSEPRP